MHYRRPPRRFTDEALADMRRRYVETDEPQEAIASDYHMHRKSLHRLAVEQGWPLRKDRPPIDVPPDLRLAIDAEEAVRADAEQAPRPAPLSLADRLEREAEQQLADLESRRRALRGELAPAADGERISRTIERLTETLYKLRRLRHPDMPALGSLPASDIPKDIDEFRRRLAFRIVCLVEEEEQSAAGRDGAGELASETDGAGAAVSRQDGSGGAGSAGQ